jgi:hypothetical protein
MFWRSDIGETLERLLQKEELAIVQHQKIQLYRPPPPPPHHHHPTSPAAAAVMI